VNGAAFDRDARAPLESTVLRGVQQGVSRAFPTLQPMTRSLAIALLLLLPALAFAQTPAQPAASAGDPVKGREKTRMCEGCHGIEGWRTAFPEVYHVPKLGGQKAAYLASALRAYKSGERDFPTMRAMVDPLSDADIADIAAYYAQGGEDATQGAKR
jgi:cytochrome c553